MSNKEKPTINTAKNEPRKRVRVIAKSGLPSRTQQQFKDEVNINNIVAKFNTAGVPIQPADNQQYADLSKAEDYQTSLNKVIRSQQAFDELPAKIRKEFDNDPKHFLHFMEDGKNLERARELGIVSRPIPKPIPVGTQIKNAVKEALKPATEADKSEPTK